MARLEIREIDRDRLGIGGSVERERECQGSDAPGNSSGRPDPLACGLLVGSVHAKERRRIDPREGTDRCSGTVELCEFGATLVTRPEMFDDAGNLNGYKLTIKVRRQLRTEVPTRKEVGRRVEDGEGPNGSPICLEATELCNGVEIGLERDDDLREFLPGELTVEVTRQQDRSPIRLWCHTGHVSIPLSIDLPRWIRDRTVPTGTSVASAISS